MNKRNFSALFILLRHNRTALWDVNIVSLVEKLHSMSVSMTLLVLSTKNVAFKNTNRYKINTILQSWSLLWIQFI